MRRKRPYTEPDRIKERIQAVKDGTVFRARQAVILELETKQAAHITRHNKFVQKELDKLPRLAI